MKEIIYIQAGSLSNYIGTHFWNAQETYFTYDDDGTESIVDHDISFQEGTSLQGQPTYCPRALIFDKKQNFGALAKYNELYAEEDSTRYDIDQEAWHSETEEHRQEAIPKSEYQEALDKNTPEKTPESVQYWSDFNRVYYNPRSIQKVPNHWEWERNDYDWLYGAEVFKKYDMDHSLMEEDFRLILEQCDLFQGLQMIFDITTFGSFSIALLEAIRDECPKSSILSFSALPHYVLGDDFAADSKAMLCTANCIRALDDLSSISVPLFDSIAANQRLARYETSAFFSAHVESATLPSRLRVMNDDLASICLQLNWPGNTKFSNLSGIAPFLGQDLDETKFVDYSHSPGTTNNYRTFSQRFVTRGLTTSQKKVAEEYFSEKIQKPYSSGTHAPSYPLPSSYPHIFAQPDVTNPPTDVALISSICSTSKTLQLFSAHANCIEYCLRMKPDLGLDFDELRLLRECFWTLHDNYEAMS